MKNNKKFNYGKELFADPNYQPSADYESQDYLDFLKSVYHKIELNTDDEKKAFKELYEYFEDPENIISKNTLVNLKKLKDKFPKILNPLYDQIYDAFINDIIYYRGGSLTAEQLSNLRFEKTKLFNKYELNKAILNKPKYIYESTGKKHYLSFSRDFSTALNFGLSPFQNRKSIKSFLNSNRIPVIIGVSGNDENIILNPDFSDAVSPFYEDESIYVSNKVKAVEIYIINANKILDYYDRIENKNNNIREKLKNNLKNY